MEMPANLRALPPEALDILRYYGTRKKNAALADDIVDGAGMSQRGFGKAIRRLVTNGYLTGDGSSVYRLTDLGQRAVQDVLALSDQPERSRAPRPTIRAVHRRLVIGVPRQLARGQATLVYVGFNEASDDDLLKDAANLMLRVNLINGEPSGAREMTLLLSHRSIHQVVEVTALDGDAARIRVEVRQLSDFTGEYEDCGGLYVDLPIVETSGESGLLAYGTNIQIQGESLVD
jgi:predicted transcriptional regulator